jgi:hypothetical protein
MLRSTFDIAWMHFETTTNERIERNQSATLKSVAGTFIPDRDYLADRVLGIGTQGRHRRQKETADIPRRSPLAKDKT